MRRRCGRGLPSGVTVSYFLPAGWALQQGCPLALALSCQYPETPDFQLQGKAGFLDISCRPRAQTHPSFKGALKPGSLP